MQENLKVIFKGYKMDDLLTSYIAAMLQAVGKSEQSVDGVESTPTTHFWVAVAIMTKIKFVLNNVQ